MLGPVPNTHRRSTPRDRTRRGGPPATVAVWRRDDGVVRPVCPQGAQDEIARCADEQTMGNREHCGRFATTGRTTLEGIHCGIWCVGVRPYEPPACLLYTSDA